ncbi:DUF2208 family protein [Aeropyrum camini]|uniref:Predicted membrane protein n=1 Tax=Aeropyrum camini SY1 = JCM 12091 TaxID=1198449 RepID=U3TG28_9CREN|nr:DUF2208 family protein [Aeropyrum camini]BAN90995.1 predicted membrane protein [Aeropyrum camini SY1 = JCM 12091]
MSMYLSRNRIILSQAFIILYSLLASILGRNWKTFAVIIVLFIILSVIMSRRSKGPLGVKADPAEIESARRLYEEKGARELQMKDEGLASDLQEQSKALMSMNLIMIVGLAYFILFWRFIDPLYEFMISNVTSHELLAHFLAFLAYFEGYFLVNTVTAYVVSKRSGPMITINMPTEYSVSEKGIVYKGLLSKTAIPFPLPEGVKVSVNEQRKFVEIRKVNTKTDFRLRLYARNPKRLYTIIERYGLGSRESRREEG